MSTKSRKKSKKTSRREYTYHVDIDGTLWHDGFPTDVPQLYSDFFRTLTRHDDGRLFATCQGETCWIHPVDTAFVVDSIDETPIRDEDPAAGLEAVDLLFVGGVVEPLDAATLFVGDAHVLYARARRGEIPVRFSRKAYYQLARYVVETEGGFGIRVGNQLHRIE